MIRFEKTSKSFRRVRVLDSVDLGFEKGDRVALVGSNGAGKTTLIRCLLGEYRHEGLVRVNELSPRDHRQSVLGVVGFVPQLPPPLKITVGQLIGFAAKVHDCDPQGMIDIAEKLGLRIADLNRRVFSKLSGGEKQKLLIGIALGRKAEILIMDEPAANLDPVARQVFFGLLAERLEDCTMLISSHRLDEVAGLVNRVIELDRGGVVLDDRVDDSVDLTSILDCRIHLKKADSAFANAIADWKFETEGNGRLWRGRVAGPDRLRFLGLISRYAGLLTGIEMKESSDESSN